jgi:hypothetical protein
MRSVTMLHKTAMFVASLAAALALAFALTAAGFAPGATPPAAATDPTTTVTAGAADVVAAPTVQVDKVYVAAPKPRKTITVHKVVGSAGGGESESEGSD